jgi:hypothetical protein
MTEEQKTWKDRLKALGLSQAGFAHMVGLRFADLCLYLNCKREPMPTTYEKIKSKLEELEN